ncbi:MAG: hypothetical protein Q8N21_03695 [bacterium]|nr:hypothetical protein [bacterium]
MKTSEKRKMKKEIVKKIDFSEMKNLMPKQIKAMKRDIKAAGKKVLAEMSRRGMGY